jgi:hypothetical protein
VLLGLLRVYACLLVFSVCATLYTLMVEYCGRPAILPLPGFNGISMHLVWLGTGQWHDTGQWWNPYGVAGWTFGVCEGRLLEHPVRYGGITA